MAVTEQQGVLAVAPPPGFFEGRVRVISTTRAFWHSHGSSRATVSAGLRKLLEAGSATAVFADQVHGARVRSGDDENPGASGDGWRAVGACDGLWTGRESTMLVCRTADCVPIVLASNDGSWISTVHAGWKGTLGRILEHAVGEAGSCGFAPSSLRIWIGPCISGAVYEVSTELADRFSGEFTDLGDGFRTGRHLDLGRLNALQAMNVGIAPKDIAISDLCTFSNPESFPSYRRDGECRGQIYTAAVKVSEQ